MPLARYGVLAGRVAGRRAEGGTDTPHYQVHVRGGADYRVAVNVLSREHPSELLYLADKLDHFVERAEADPAARVYPFGQRWGPEPGVPDKVFGFSPGNGVHDVHMNQGNSQQFRQDDGVWQDGGLPLAFPAPRLAEREAHGLDLAGWSIVDQAKRRLVLDGGSLPAGETVRVALGPTVQLGNRGGLVTLLDPDGLKVDGVAYTRSQAAAEGWSVVF
jgi:uncharacterized protein DUF2278